MRLGFILLAAAGAFAQPAQIQILASASRLTAGESIQLQAAVRDARGLLLKDVPVQWTLNPFPTSLASIDSEGRLTGHTLGIVVVRAEVPNGPRVESPFQILPLRFTITPTALDLAIGATRQFTAAAFDKDGRALPNINVEWTAIGANYDGPPPTPCFELSPAGLARGVYECGAYVRATFNYTLPNAGVPLNMTTRLMAQAPVRVSGSRDYTVRTAYSSARAANTGTELRYRPSLLWAASDGSLYFNAALGSTSNALLRWQDGRLTPALLGGRASTNPGSTVLDFGQHAMNAVGDVLAFEITTDANRILRAASNENFRPLLVNNTPGAGVDFIGGYSLSRHSLNRYSQFLFRASYRDPLTRQFYTGLFRGSGASVDELVFSNKDPLPELPPGSFNIDWSQFGITDDATLYYRVTVPGRNVLYRQDANGRAKFLATGDRFQNSTITNFIGPPDGAPAQGTFFAPAGEVITGLQLADNRSLLARYPAAAGEAPEVLALSWSAAAVLDHHPTRGTLIFAPLDNQLRVALWQNGPAETLLSLGDETIAGTKIESIFSGAFGPNGEIYLLARGDNAKMLGLQLRPEMRVLFQSGDRLTNTPAPVFFGFAGARSGPLQVFTGGSGGNASISEWQGGTFQPKLTVGDTLGRNSLFPGANTFGYSRTRNGQTFALVPWVGSNRDFGIARLRADGSPELLYPFNLRIDGLEYFQPYRIVANDRGDLLWQTGTPRGDQRVVLTRNGVHRVILTDNGDPNAPSIVDGLTVNGIDNLAMDENGRVLAVVRFRERFTQSLIGWDGETWRRLAGVNETTLDRRRVTGLGVLRTAGNHLMAHIYFDGLSAVAAWNGGAALETVISPGELTPLGYVVNWLPTFDVNSRGDIAYISGYPEGGQGVFVKRAGRTYVVLNSARPLADGELLMALNQLELRDDGTVYLLAPNAKSESLLIEALPR